jgi:trk system potassium uptake protein TrkH
LNKVPDIKRLLQSLLLAVQIIAWIAIIEDIGFETRQRWSPLYAILVFLLFVAGFSLLWIDRKTVKKLSWVPTLVLGLLVARTLYNLLSFQEIPKALEELHDYYIGSIALFLLHQISLAARRLLFQERFNPATLFVGSFIALITLGTLLLRLPAATTTSISIVDAAFTATSAVCVTGLIVVDTANDFTFFGQCVILLLIQLGGLGVLTITSFFAYYFTGQSSIRESLNLRDMVSSEDLGNVFKLLIKIVAFTMVIELMGAAYIYLSLDPGLFKTWFERVFFAVFHSVSAFCNAGFSILKDNLYDVNVRFNYGFQWGIILLIIFGGLGFNILNNFYEFFKSAVKHFLAPLQGKPDRPLRPRIISLNSRIVVYTTLALLGFGFLFFLVSERESLLRVHESTWGKFTTAFFMSTTPRTAGFNTFDLSILSMPAIMVTMALMWIGASPASTGGGIKTSTFAVAILNVVATIRGRAHIEIGYRQIPGESVQRAFTIVILSLIAIGTSIVALVWLEPDMDLIHITFECISAYSTVGLSLGITATLEPASKGILIVLMFVGRVGAVNLLIGLIQRRRVSYYKYPQESILIN